MKNLEKIKDKLMLEVDEIARKSELSAGDVETVHKLTDTIKNIDKICMYEGEGGYSGDYYGVGRGGHWNAQGSYDGGMSGARGRRRDRMGRYSRSDGKEKMIDTLEDLMDDADDSRVKSAIKRCISELEKD